MYSLVVPAITPAYSVNAKMMEPDSNDLQSSLKKWCAWHQVTFFWQYSARYLVLSRSSAAAVRQFTYFSGTIRPGTKDFGLGSVNWFLLKDPATKVPERIKCALPIQWKSREEKKWAWFLRGSTQTRARAHTQHTHIHTHTYTHTLLQSYALPFYRATLYYTSPSSTSTSL